MLLLKERMTSKTRWNQSRRKEDTRWTLVASRRRRRRSPKIYENHKRPQSVCLTRPALPRLRLRYALSIWTIDTDSFGHRSVLAGSSW